MSILIFQNEASANSRTVHFHIFKSNGTSPDTGSSNSSVIQVTPSGGTFVPNAKIVATHAAQGEYCVVLNQSDVSLVGMNSLYFTQGDFPQKLANLTVTAFNPFNVADLALSGLSTDIWDVPLTSHTVAGSLGLRQQIVRMNTAQGGAAGQIKLDAGASATTSLYNDHLIFLQGGTGAGQARSIFSYSGSGLTAYVMPNWVTNPDNTSVFLLLPQGGQDVYQLSGESSAASNLAQFFDGTGYTSAGTVGVSRIALGTYSGVTFGAGDYAAKDMTSKLTVGVGSIAAGTYSGVTVGSAATILVGTYSGVTLGINNIAAGTYSGVTVGSAATILAGGILTSSFAAGAIDNTILSTNAEQAIADRLLLRNIAGGSDSGRTVGTALYSLRNKVDASSSVGTVYFTDDSTSAWTFSITTGSNTITAVKPSS